MSVGDVRYTLVRRPWRKSCNSYVFDTFLLFTMHRGLNLNWDTVCVSQFMSFEFQSNKLKVGILTCECYGVVLKTYFSPSAFSEN